jgi:hypothetical protein
MIYIIIILIIIIIIFCYYINFFIKKNIKENFDKSFYEDVDYLYKQYNYGDLEYVTPLKCDRYFDFMVDPNMPNTLGCYIKLDDMKKYYNPTLTDCPSIWNYNIEKDGVKYCRRNGANLPINL